MIDTTERSPFASAMRFRTAICLLVLLAAPVVAQAAREQNEYRQLTEATTLPVALDDDFEFRKTKIQILGADDPRRPFGRVRGGPRDPAVGFESTYLLHGAITALDLRQRYGHYFDFFWRVKRPADVTVRLEYRQQALREFTQAREVDYRDTKGSHRTSFAIIGDDFLNDGRVLAWRCLLIEKGRIVAEERSYLWR